MSNHITGRRLFSYLDGELGRREKRAVERHLQSCWICRAEMHRQEANICMILDAQENVLEPALPAPPQVWPSFETLLSRRALSRKERFFLFLHPLRQPLRLLAIPASFVVLLLVMLFSNHPQPVSAQEVIRRIKQAESTQTISNGQVVHERVHVRRRTHHTPESSTQSEEVSVWKSHAVTYWDTPPDHSAVVDLEAAYRSHNVSMELPLAMGSIEQWSSIAGGPAMLSQQGDDVGLSFGGDAAKGEGSLERVHVVVQPKTWSVTKLTLDFSDVSFEITEESRMVLPLHAAPAYLLTRLDPPADGAPLESASGVESPAPSIHMAAADLNAATLDVDATLHRLQADLGEPVTVTRRDQDVQVGIWQLPSARRTQIAKALKTIAGVSVQTSAPTTASPSERQQVIVYRATTEGPAPSALSIPPESGARWKEFFTEDGSEEEYTRRAFTNSTTVLSHLYALRNLQDQFPPERESRLSNEQHAELQRMVDDHATAANVSLARLNAQIDPLAAAFHAPSVTPPECIAITTWQSPSIEALDTAKVLDHVLHRLLATGEAPLSPEIALPQIQHQLAQLSYEMKCLHVVSR